MRAVGTLVVMAFTIAACAAPDPRFQVERSLQTRLPHTPRTAAEVPRFQVDPSWPRTLPHNWIMGQAAGVAVDKRDHVWVIQRPASLTDDEKAASFDPPNAKCCLPAPPVMEFDQDGKLIQAWGGPGEGYDWPQREHGITIDDEGFVWIGGNGPRDGQYLKFTRDGKFVMQIGKAGAQTNSQDTSRLGQPADAEIDRKANEVYIADGYANHRVIVFDASTGEYRRQWGAFGNKPSDAALPSYQPDSPQFSTPVHCVKIAADGLVYVCDRRNNRIQVFRKDGTFVRQFVLENGTRAAGSVWALGFSIDPAQTFMIVADGTNNEVRTLVRESGEVVGAFGHAGRNAGQFHWVHDIALDSNGNIYSAEVDTGKRAQKFVPMPPGR